MNSALIAVDQEATIVTVMRDRLEWRISYQGTHWTARATDANANFSRGDRVYVVGRQNLLLLIQSIPPMPYNDFSPVIQVQGIYPIRNSRWVAVAQYLKAQAENLLLGGSVDES